MTILLAGAPSILTLTIFCDEAGGGASLAWRIDLSIYVLMIFGVYSSSYFLAANLVFYILGIKTCTSFAIVFPRGDIPSYSIAVLITFPYLTFLSMLEEPCGALILVLITLLCLESLVSSAGIYDSL